MWTYLCLFLLNYWPNQSAITTNCDFLGDDINNSRIECGTIQVPENHRRPDGKQITIAYVILKSENPDSREYPMIHFTGGPGGQALRNVERHLDNPILKTRDIIRFDQRGIGYSSPLPDLTTPLYNLLPENLTSTEERYRIADLVAHLQKTCEEKGIDLNRYNTFQNARDVGMLMDHLGYEKYNLRGGSYGTRIARVVADFFPEKIHAAIYDSPAPHRSDYLLSRMEDYQSALQKVFDYCAENRYCRIQYPNLKATYFEVLNQLAAAPLEATYEGKPFYLNPQDAIFFLRYELYKSDARSLAPKFIYALKEKDLEWINQVIESRGMSNSNYALFLACENFEEYDHSVTAERVAAKYDDLELLPYELPIFTSLYLASADLLESYATPEMKKMKISDIPSLLFINQFDPVTPPKNLVVFQARMRDSQSFILDAGGHGGGDMDCKRAIMDAFMSAPDAPLDTKCLKLYGE